MSAVGGSPLATRRSRYRRADFVRGWRAIHSAFRPQDLGAIYRGVNGDAKTRAIALAIVDGRSMDPLAPTMFLYLSEPGKAFAAFQKYKTGLSDAFLNFLWLPTDWSRYARRHPSFQMFASRLGMTAYWKKNGWPDLCRPAPNRGPDAFDCAK